jgi:hypothetical protein
LAAIDEWEHNRVQDVRAEAERRRHEHRQAGDAAVARMQAAVNPLRRSRNWRGSKLGRCAGC